MTTRMNGPDWDPAETAEEERTAKKQYQSPQLVEWGTVVDLTLGAGGGYEDVPMDGTQPF